MSPETRRHFFCREGYEKSIERIAVMAKISKRKPKVSFTILIQQHCLFVVVVVAVVFFFCDCYYGEGLSV